MEIRHYQKSDLTAIIRLFHDTVHKVNIKDYSQVVSDGAVVKSLQVAATRNTDELQKVSEVNHGVLIEHR